MRLALCCLLSLLLLTSALWRGDDGLRAGDAAEPVAAVLTLAAGCEPWDELRAQSEPGPREISVEPLPPTLDDGAELCTAPVLRLPGSPLPAPGPQPAPVPDYAGPWLRVPQRPPSPALA